MMNAAAASTPVAIVTGAARGIGLAAAKRLIQDGARVALWDADGGALNHALADLGTDGTQVTTTVMT